MKYNNINFIYSSSFLKQVFVIGILVFISSVLLLNLNLAQALTLFLILGIGGVILLYYLGDKRKNEIEKIRQLVRSISKNRNISMNHIRFDKPLEKLEVNIKAMLQKTQDDFANMQRLEQTRTEFLGNVSHELRTPIFAIQGFLETLLDGALHDENVNRKFLKKAFRHTENLNDLLNDLIDISMIESGQMRMKPEYFNFQEFLAPIIADMGQQMGQKTLTIRMEVSDPEIITFGDKDRIRAIMINLLTNAIKYSEEGEIVVSVKEKDGSVNISVKDTGIGISKDDINRIFERFYRVDKARSKEVGGSGLGLAIVKHILDAHGSRIRVESSLGEGSIFSFKLRSQSKKKS